MSHASVFIIIDPQKAFTDPDGTLGRVYGASELSPIQEALIRLEDFLQRMPAKENIYYIKSQYLPGQFTNSVLADPYAYVCTKENTLDLEWSIPEYLLQKGEIFQKNVESAYAISKLREQVTRQIDNGLQKIYFAGFLFTSCVAKSALEFKANLSRSVQVVIIEDLCGARQSKFEMKKGNSEYQQTRMKLADSGIQFCRSHDVLWDEERKFL